MFTTEEFVYFAVMVALLFGVYALVRSLWLGREIWQELTGKRRNPTGSRPFPSENTDSFSRPGDRR